MKVQPSFTQVSSLKVIAQIVDINYRGPQPGKRSGALAALLNSVSMEIDENLPNQKETSSASRDFLSQVGCLLPTEIDSKRLRFARDKFMVNHMEAQTRVKDFHAMLNSLKLELLRGRTKRTLSQLEVDDLKTKMTPYNVGKILKVSIQVRLVSAEPFPGSHPCKDGHSLVKVLYTFYSPYLGKDVSVSQMLDNIVDELVTYYNDKSTSGYADANCTEIALTDDLETIKMFSYPVTELTVTDKQGMTRTVNPENLKAENFGVQLRRAYSHRFTKGEQS